MGSQAIALTMMIRDSTDRLANVLGSSLWATLTRHEHSPMLPDMEPVDIQAHYIARTADVLIDTLEATVELPAHGRHRLITLAITIRDAADRLSDELDLVWLAILGRQYEAAVPPAPILPQLRGSNVIPFRRP